MKPLFDLTDLLQMYLRPWQVPIKKVDNWFPLYPSEKLAEICGFLIGDGHVQPYPRWRIDFTSNSLQTLDYVNSLFVDLFGISGKVRKCATNHYGTHNLGVNCKPLARTLFLCGVPTGAKVTKQFPVPKWILDDKTYFRSFIRAYFSCEACVDATGRILLEHWKTEENIEAGEEFMNQIINGLNSFFDISCNGPYFPSQRNFTKNGITQGIQIQIRRKSELTKYVQNVGFVDFAKQLKAESLWCGY